MRRTRMIAGTILIVLAVIGMIFWETKGREVLLMEEVLVAAQRIEEDVQISPSMLRTTKVLKENVVEGALQPSDVKKLSKRATSHVLSKNQQVTSIDLVSQDQQLKKDLHIFPLKSEWIDSRSSSLRKDDWVAIYQAVNGAYVGTYRLAFVKDESEQEVTNQQPGKNKIPLSRTVSTGKISYVEIIAAVSDYQNIRSIVGAGLAEDMLQEKLILVGTEQEGDE